MTDGSSTSELRATRLVVERELREAVRRRAVWITGGLLLLGSAAVMILPEVVSGSSDHRDVAVVDAGDDVEVVLDQVAAAFEIDLRTTSAPDRDAAEQLVRDDDADAAVIAGEQGPWIVMSSDDDDRLLALLRQAMAAASVNERLHASGLDDEQIADALAAPDIGVDVLDTERGGRRAAAFAASIVMYLLLLLLTMQVATGIAIEKANRVSEVLLAIVRPRSMLFGKVIGVALIGCFTLVCGALPVAAKLIAGGDLPPDVGPTLAASGAWFVLGVALYLITAGALGALVDRQEEVGTAVGPLSVLLIAAYLVGQSAADTRLGTVLAYIPFTSPMVMPPRIALGVTSPVEIVLSLALGAVTVVVVGRVAAAVYRRAIVRTGRRLHLREMLRPAT